MGAVEIPNVCSAAAIIAPVPENVSLTAELVSSKGVLGFTRLSAGQYEVALEHPLAFTEGIPIVTLPTNMPMIATAQLTAPGVVRVAVVTRDGGESADPSVFYLTVVAFNLGGGVGFDLPVFPPYPPTPASRVLTAARVVYVSPTGDDDNDGLTALTAWATVARMGRDLQSYSLLDATYTWHSVGTGTLANADISIPPKTLRGSFDYVCDTLTVLAGPFTVLVNNPSTTGVPPNLTVASGLGVNTHRSKTLRLLTGAGIGQLRSICQTTDTVLTYTRNGSPAFAAGNTFDIVEPAIALSGDCIWRDPAPMSNFAFIDNGGGCNCLVNLKLTATLQLVGGLWYAWGVQVGDTSAVRVQVNAARFSCGYYSGFGGAIARLGITDLESFAGWGVGQAVSNGLQSAVNVLGTESVGSIDMCIVAPRLQAGTSLDAGGARFQTGPTNTAIELTGGCLYGGGNAPTLEARCPVLYAATMGWLTLQGNVAQPLIEVVDTALVFTGTARLQPGALMTRVLSTRGNALASFKGASAAACAAGGSFGTDARLGGTVRFDGAPVFTGAGGDNIVDTAVGAVANAFFAAAQTGIFNANTAALICREF